MAYREAVRMVDDSGEDFARELLKYSPFIGDEVNEEFARHILNEAFIKWFSTGRAYDTLSHLGKTKDGETVAVYGSHSEVEAGAFRLEFVPLYAVKKIVSDCAHIYDECIAGYRFRVSPDIDWQRGARDEAIRGMALIATRRLLIGLRTRIFEALEDNLDESLLLAKAAIQGSLKMFLEGEYTEEREPVDCRKDIADAVDRVAKREREHREGLLSHNVPKVQVSGPGRPSGPTKSEEEKARQRSEFERQIEDTIKKLIADSGTIPTKTKVAQELSIGGRSPHTGNDTSLSTFNSKLQRCGVNYEEIVRRVTLIERPRGPHREEVEHGE
jgi:hypothetical protein